MRSGWLSTENFTVGAFQFPLRRSVFFFFFHPSFNVVSSGGTTMFQEIFFVTEPTLYPPCSAVPFFI